MKTNILIALFTAFSLYAFAQVPQAIKYQSVLRDISGQVLSNQNVSLRLSIHAGSSSGTMLYSETHAVTTNPFGLIHINIGQGSVVSGDFQLIPWSLGNQWLKVELDPSGASNFQNMGASELLSVPYAFYSEASGNSGTGANINCGTSSNNYYTIRGSGSGAWECEDFLQVSYNAVGINTTPNSSFDLKVYGNVGIGSSPSSSYDLSVDGNARIDDHLALGTSTSTSYKLDVDGDVRVQDGLGVGTYPSYSGLTVGSSSNFYVKTSLSSGTGTTLVISSGEVKKESSSKRYKSNISDLKVSKESVFKLRPVSYLHNISLGGDGSKDIGLIAEEVELYVPDLVVYDYDEFGSLRAESVKYNRLSVYLLEIIKNQDLEIIQLKNRITEIEAKLNKLIAD